ncbi:uncharacterized protein DS421_19g651420 [Arachis hypogaea]|uniref:Uncharacterized protein n=1 Tax=Arachis hypogaea TaxID=3818 RepID=A0A6B9V7A6_ARAHY|nr:uncharacterized protein DS421_19g651420 [Arachis hypogaea]
MFLLFFCVDVENAILTVDRVQKNLCLGLDEAAGVPFMQIEPESQTKLLDATLNLEGVLLAGVPGAGGFDSPYRFVDRFGFHNLKDQLIPNQPTNPAKFKITQPNTRFSLQRFCRTATAVHAVGASTSSLVAQALSCSSASSFPLSPSSLASLFKAWSSSPSFHQSPSVSPSKVSGIAFTSSVLPFLLCSVC